MKAESKKVSKKERKIDRKKERKKNYEDRYREDITNDNTNEINYPNILLLLGDVPLRTSPSFEGSKNPHTPIQALPNRRTGVIP